MSADRSPTEVPPSTSQHAAWLWVGDPSSQFTTCSLIRSTEVLPRDPLTPTPHSKFHNVMIGCREIFPGERIDQGLQKLVVVDNYLWGELCVDLPLVDVSGLLTLRACDGRTWMFSAQAQRLDGKLLNLFSYLQYRSTHIILLIYRIRSAVDKICTPRVKSFISTVLDLYYMAVKTRKN